MTLKEMIYHRKSCRSFTGKPVDAEMIEKILSFERKPLYPEIKVRMDIVPRNQVKCICPWTTPQLITVYSEEADGYLENIGFLFQQMDLYLQTLGLGVCWLGMGRTNPRTTTQVEGMKFVIMLAFHTYSPSTFSSQSAAGIVTRLRETSITTPSRPMTFSANVAG